MDPGIKKMGSLLWNWTMIVVVFGLVLLIISAYQTNTGAMRDAIDAFWKNIAG